MTVLEEIVALLEIAPERNEFRLIATRGGEGSEAVIGEARGENFEREMLLSCAVDQDGEPVDFLDAVVGDRDATDGSAVSVKENVAAQILPKAKNTVGGVGIVDVQAQEEIALRIEPVEFVETLWDLLITKSPLRAENSGGGADVVVVDENVRLVGSSGGPKLEGSFFFEGAKQNGVRGIRKPFCLKSLA